MFFKLPMSWALWGKMDHKAKFQSLAETDTAVVKLHLFGWTDKSGNGGDYGLNVGAVENTFTTLINTTYMFQPEPAFVLHCRPFEMSAAQFDYLQDHDLDTQEFLSSLGDLPAVSHELDLSLYKDATSALAGLKAIL